MPTPAAPAAPDADPAELTGLAGWTVDVVEALGPPGVGLLVALENVFPPLPSEVILPVAGFVASQGGMGLIAAIMAATIGSLAGALLLYALGARVGRHRLRRWATRTPLVDVRDLDRAEAWFARHGGKAVLLGRCMPVVRSFVSIPAGVARMSMLPFVLYTTIGSGLWNTLFILGGYQLGARWENIGRYSDVINYTVIGLIVALIVRFVTIRLRHRAKSG
jgi:membrane protein DedA with SNARE-associated domain